MRFGLKRGKLVYVFKFAAHDVERDKHRNVISRARFIRSQLELAGYQLIPWDFKKGQPPRFWLHEHPEQQDQHQFDTAAMDEEDDDLYGPSGSTAPSAGESTQPKTEPPQDGDASEGDEPMDEGLESGEETDDSDDSVGP